MVNVILVEQELIRSGMKQGQRKPTPPRLGNMWYKYNAQFKLSSKYAEKLCQLYPSISLPINLSSILFIILSCYSTVCWLCRLFLIIYTPGRLSQYYILILTSTARRSWFHMLRHMRIQLSPIPITMEISWDLLSSNQ